MALILVANELPELDRHLRILLLGLLSPTVPPGTPQVPGMGVSSIQQSGQSLRSPEHMTKSWGIFPSAPLITDRLLLPRGSAPRHTLPLHPERSSKCGVAGVCGKKPQGSWQCLVHIPRTLPFLCVVNNSTHHYRCVLEKLGFSSM